MPTRAIWTAVLAALARGGIELVEVTLDTPGALDAVDAGAGPGGRSASAPCSSPIRSTGASTPEPRSS